MNRLVGPVLQFVWIRVWLWTPRHSGNAALDRSASAGKTHDRFISAPEDLVLKIWWWHRFGHPIREWFPTEAGIGQSRIVGGNPSHQIGW